jgi:hypothetical protein
MSDQTAMETQGMIVPGDVRPGTLLPPIARNRRVLGKAIHVAALMRLHELWPEAVVKVRHGRSNVFGKRYWTRVTIMRSGPGTGSVYATAKCAPGDSFNRRYGISLAFRRALDKVRERPLADFGKPERS